MENNWDKSIVVIQNVTRFLRAVASLLAPWLAPFAPAIFLGWAVYLTAIQSGMSKGLAISAALATGIGWETVNIAANHAMLQLSHGAKNHVWKFVFSIALVVGYLAAGVVSMIYLEVTVGVRVIGIASFALASVAIASQALTLDLARTQSEVEEEKRKEADEIIWKRRREREEAGRKERLALAEIEAKKEIKTEQTRANVEVRLEREKLKAGGRLSVKSVELDTRGAILAYLNRNGKVKAWDDLINDLKIERTLAAMTLLDLEREGAIKRNGNKVWVVATDF